VGARSCGTSRDAVISGRWGLAIVLVVACTPEPKVTEKDPVAEAVRISGYEEWTSIRQMSSSIRSDTFDAVEYARQIRDGVSSAP